MCLAGCGDDVPTKPPGRAIPEPGILPAHHETPVWSVLGQIAYRDRGIVCVDSITGFYTVDPALRGVWVVDLATRRHQLIASDSYTPSWSPDGTRLALEHNYQICVGNLDGSDVRQLTFADRNLRPAWSPDGRRIAFEHMSERWPNEVWIMGDDGSDAHPIIQWAQNPSWSPDGNRLVCTRWTDLGESATYILVFDFRDSTLTQLKRTEFQLPMTVRFSPTGEYLSYEDRGADWWSEIWIMKADGSTPRQLTHEGGKEAAWSPDGRSIVYVRHEWREDDPYNGVLWIADVATGSGKRLLERWPQRCP